MDDNNIGTQKYRVTSMLRHCAVVYMSPVKLLTGVSVNSAHRRPRKLLSMIRLTDHTDSEDLGTARQFGGKGSFTFTINDFHEMYY